MMTAMLRLLALCLALIHLSPVHATVSSPTGLRLFSASEWQVMCEAFERSDLVEVCLAKVHRAVAYGRSLGIFEAVRPDNGQVLQTRSGVFLNRNLNELLLNVREDNSLTTRLRLKEDVNCQVYSAAPDLVGRPQAERNYLRLVQSWLREYSDDIQHGAPRVRIATVDQRTTLQFDVDTETQRTISGHYVFDDKANAGIFTTCDHPAQSLAARRNTTLFLKSVLGSARRFI